VTEREREDDGSVDVEAEWADIVARWESETPPTGAWSAAEDATGADEPGTPDEPVDVGWTGHVGGEASRAAAAREDVEPDEEGYVPPEPPPLRLGDTVSRLAWAGVLGAPVFFVITMLFWRSVPTVLVVFAVAAFVAGFVTLVLRMPDRDDDGWDDGAVV